MYEFADSHGERSNDTSKVLLEVATRATIEGISKYRGKLEARLNSDDFKKKLEGALGAQGEAWKQFIAAYQIAAGKAESSSNNTVKDKSEPPHTGKKVSDSSDFNFDYSDLPTTYTTQYVNRFSTEIANSVSSLDSRDGKAKNLAEILKKCQENPSSGNVIILQNTLAQDWGKRISKDGKPDGDFGPMTLAAIKEIVGNDVVTPAKKVDQSAQANNAPAAKIATQQEAAAKEVKSPDIIPTSEIAEQKPQKTEGVKIETAVNDLSAVCEKVVTNGNQLKSKMDTIKSQTNLFNISSQVDKATPIIKDYLQANVKDLNMLAADPSSLPPEAKVKISGQLKELLDGLRKGAKSGMVSESSRNQMATWVPEVDKLYSKFA